MSKSINISTSLRQTINDSVDLSSCVSATDWNEENIELDTDVLSRLANLESEMIENSNAIDVLEANQFTLVNYDGSVGDIEIGGSSGNSGGDYNNLANRPCYEDQGFITYTHDGNNDGKETVIRGGLYNYVKISDDIDSIQIDSIEEGKVKYVITYSNGTIEEREAGYIEFYEGSYMEIDGIIIDDAVVIALRNNFYTEILFNPITFSEKGIYLAFRDGYAESEYVSSVSFPNNTVKQLDEKFIPDTIARTVSDELLTQDKNIIGAINEVFLSGVSVKQQLVDALIAKGIEGISTSDSFEVLIGKIADFSASSAPVEGCNLIAVTELPASGDPDSLYILTSIEPNVIHVGREQPEKSAMALGDIWVDLDAHEDTIRELRTLTIGAISINFRMRSCYQKTSQYSSADLTEVFAYSWTGTEWKRVVPVIIPVIAATSTTYEYEALDTTYVRFASSNTKTVYFKENYQGKGTLVMEHAFHFGNGADTIKVVAKVYDEYGTLYNTVTHSKTLSQAFEETTATIDVLPSGYLNVTATLTSGAEITAYLNVYCKKA